MILEIRQTTANGTNNFEITEQGRLIYKALTNFLKPNSPLGGDSLRKLLLMDADDNMILHTHYDVRENLVESSIPLGYLFRDSKKVRRYNILDSSNRLLGNFYYELTGIADSKMVIEYENKYISCFKRCVGNKEVITFYDGETQIGQLTKPNCVVNNHDFYFVHFSDSYRFMQNIISLFVIYFDYIFHNHSGEIAQGYSWNKTYTYDRNSKKYNKNYIRDNFGIEENHRVENFIKNTYDSRAQKSGFNLKKFWLIFGCGWTAAFILALIALLIILNNR